MNAKTRSTRSTIVLAALLLGLSAFAPACETGGYDNVLDVEASSASAAPGAPAQTKVQARSQSPDAGR